MLRKLSLVALVIATHALSALAQLPEGQAWVGQRVVTKFAQPIRAGNRTIDNGTTYRVYLVEKFDDGILTIVSGGVRGWIWASDVVPFSKAVEFYTSEIAYNRGNVSAYNWRGLIERDAGNFDKAIADFTEAIKHGGDGVHPYNNRGNTLLLKGDADKAIADFDAALKIDAKHVMAMTNRGRAWASKGEAAKALADFEASVAIDPKYPPAHCERAWLRATSPIDSMRDGKAAIADAQIAVDAAAGASSRFLDTLAAAYAESGQFDKAVQTQERTLKLASKSNRNYKAYQERLELYRAGKPFRDTSPNIHP